MRLYILTQLIKLENTFAGQSVNHYFCKYLTIHAYVESPDKAT